MVEALEGVLSLSDGLVKGKIYSGMLDCSIVYHCVACQKDGKSTSSYGTQWIRMGTEVVLDAAAAAKVRVLMHISSFETVGFGAAQGNQDFGDRVYLEG